MAATAAKMAAASATASAVRSLPPSSSRRHHAIPFAPRPRPRRGRSVTAVAARASALDTLLGARIIAPNGGGDGDVRDSVTKYYGETLKTSDDLKTSACCTPNALPKAIRDILSEVPDEVKAKYYGCGSPTPLGIQGLRVLDLGSGSGRDCYVASALVGAEGSVTGIDMTDAQLEVGDVAAETHLAFAPPSDARV